MPGPSVELGLRTLDGDGGGKWTPQELVPSPVFELLVVLEDDPLLEFVAVPLLFEGPFPGNKKTPPLFEFEEPLEPPATPFWELFWFAPAEEPSFKFCKFARGSDEFGPEEADLALSCRSSVNDLFEEEVIWPSWFWPKGIWTLSLGLMLDNGAEVFPLTGEGVEEALFEK